MIRTRIIPKDQRISIEVPPAFIGKQVEVIAFTTSEVIGEQQETEMTLTHFAAENTLGKDWNTPEEDQAWQDL